MAGAPTGRQPAVVDPTTTLPDYAVAYKERIREEFEYLKSLDLVDDPKLRDQIDASLSNPKGTTWSDLFFIERTILRFQPDDTVRRRAWSMRDDYRAVIGEEAYQDYLKSDPPLAAFDKPVGPLREDLDRLLCEFHWRYQTTPMREGERNRVSGRIAFGMFIGVVLVLIAMGLDHLSSGKTGLSTVLMVLLMGAMGAFVSLQHRIQSFPSNGDAILNILSIREGWVSVFLTPLSGAVFAFVLFLAFSAGLLQGSLFPDVIAKPNSPTADVRVAQVARLKAEVTEAETAASAAKAQADRTPTDTAAAARAAEFQKLADQANVSLQVVESRGLSFLTFLHLAIPRTVADLAKLLLWCFVAGFAERLLPDTLDRLIVRKIAVMEPETAKSSRSSLILADSGQSRNGGGKGNGQGGPASPSTSAAATT